MVSGSGAQAKFSIRVNSLGATVTIYSRSNVVLNAEGDETITWSAGTSTKAIRHSGSSVFSTEIRPEGEPIHGDLVLYFKGTETLDEGYKILYNSETYEIIDINPGTHDNTVVYYKVSANRLTLT